MAEVFRNQWWVVVRLVGEPFVRLVRTGAPFSDLADGERATREITGPLRGHERILIDFRGGPPGRNDAPFEQASVAWRKTLQETFARRAVLVKSAVGKLQVNRLSKPGPDTIVTQDEAEAVRFLS